MYFEFIEDLPDLMTSNSGATQGPSARSYPTAAAGLAKGYNWGNLLKKIQEAVCGHG